MLEYQQGRFIYSLDKSLTNEMMMQNNNNNINNLQYYNSFNRMQYNPVDMKRMEMIRFPPFNRNFMYGQNDPVNFCIYLIFQRFYAENYENGDDDKKKKSKKKKDKKHKKSKNLV